MKSISILLATSVLALGYSITAAADSQLIDNSPHFGETGWEVSLGAGIFSATDNINLYKRDDDDLENGFFVPLEATYIGERFYFKADEVQGLVLGYTLTQDQNWAIDAVLSPRFAGPIDNDLLEDADLDDRDPDLHAGIRYSMYFDDSLIRLDASRDISGTHDGYILSAAYDHEWQIRNWLVTGTASVDYISKDMTDYYVGVDRDEATGQFPVYQAEGAVITGIALDAEYPLNENWTFNTVLGYLILGDEIEDSPITNDDGKLAMISTSVRYHF